jgi:hypothetical protein
LEDNEKKHATPNTSAGQKEQLDDYQDKESKIKNTTRSCKDCGKAFSNAEELTSHYRKEHPEAL